MSQEKKLVPIEFAAFTYLALKVAPDLAEKKYLPTDELTNASLFEYALQQMKRILEE